MTRSESGHDAIHLTEEGRNSKRGEKNDHRLHTKSTSVCVCASLMWRLALGYFLNCQALRLIKKGIKTRENNESRTLF